MTFTDRLQHAFNAFMNKAPTQSYDNGPGYFYRPDRPRLSRGNERSMVNSIYNRIAMDCAQIPLEHVRVDDEGRYLETFQSTLNYCLNTEANLDQTGRAFRQDIVMSMLDQGVIAAVPIDTDDEIDENNNVKIYTMRTGKVTQWYPKKVTVDVYNEETGKHQEITVWKSNTAIIENPFYTVMNEPNSTNQRLIRKLNLLDAIDEQSGSGKLDLIVQLPYSVKGEVKRQQAEQRRKDIENQLTGSKYGIAYIDATEHVTQLNRSVENNLLNQIEYLQSMLYSQLGLTKEIMDGSASPEVLNNYYSRTIEPILSAIADEMKRKFLTKTARTQGQSICFYRDILKLLPLSQLAETADKLTRNEIVSSNEIRQSIGLKPSQDPKADELTNKNIRQESGAPNEQNPSNSVDEVTAIMNELLDGLQSDVTNILNGEGGDEDGNE